MPYVSAFKLPAVDELVDGALPEWDALLEGIPGDAKMYE